MSGVRDGVRSVRIKDVAPRLACQATPVPTEVKVELVDRLTAAGVPAVEVSSFVRPDLVPGLADAADVFARVQRREGVELSCCIGNARGLRDAIDAGADSAWFLLSVDPGFARDNIGLSQEDAFHRLAELARLAAGSGTRLGTYLIFAWGGPAGPPRDAGEVLGFFRRLREIGVEEWILADSAGYAAPPQLRTTVTAAAEQGSLDNLTVQIHDARGMGLAGVVELAGLGVRNIDTSLGGAGGHPAIPGAPGGCVCTEDAVQLLERMGVATGIDLPGLVEASRWFLDETGIAGPGFTRHVGPVLADGVHGARTTFSWESA